MKTIHATDKQNQTISRRPESGFLIVYLGLHRYGYQIYTFQRSGGELRAKPRIHIQVKVTPFNVGRGYYHVVYYRNIISSIPSFDRKIITKLLFM